MSAKRGLGRGLDALFQDVKREEDSFSQVESNIGNAPKIRRASEIETKAFDAASVAVPAAGTGSSQRKLAVEKLVPGKFQPRHHFDEAALEQLAESITVHGILQPLLVRPLSGSMFEIIAGERRWRAAQQAQLHEVPVVIRDLTDKEALEIGLIENLQREDLSALEEAEGYQRLMDEFDRTQDQLATELGKSRSHIANTLRLLKLPASVKTLVQNGILSAGHARTLIGAKNPEELASVIIKRHLSVRQAEKLAQAAIEGKRKPAKRRAFVQKDVDILALEEKITATLGLRVSIEGTPEGKITLQYKSLDQLDDVIARLIGKMA